MADDEEEEAEDEDEAETEDEDDETEEDAEDEPAKEGEVQYSDGVAAFTLEDGVITWADAAEDAGQGLCFEPVKD